MTRSTCEFGKVRVKQGGGAAGHNGIRSIDAHLGPDFWRVRIGVGHPGVKELVKHYVLHDFDAEEKPEVETHGRRDRRQLPAAVRAAATSAS